MFPKNNPCRNCSDFTDCHQGKGVCWKTILMAYGPENFLNPDPTCPKAPPPTRCYWLV